MKKFFEKHNFFSFLLFNLLMIWIFALLLFSLADSVHASGVESESYFPMDQNDNDRFNDLIYNSFYSTYDPDDYYFLLRYKDVTFNAYGYFFQYYSCVVPKGNSNSIFAEILSNGYQFSLYKTGNVIPECRLCTYDSYGNSTSFVSADFYTDFQNLDSSLYSFQAYASNFTLYTNNTSNRVVVLKGPDFDDRPHGHSLIPPQPIDPEYSSGDSSPTDVPIISNFQNGDNFLGKTIQYYGNLINSQLNDTKQNLYDNLLPQYYVFSQFYNFGLDLEGNFTLTNAIGNLFEYLFIPDPDDLTDLIESYDNFGIIDFAELSTTYWGNVKTLVTSGDSLFSIRINAFSIMGVVCGPYFVDFSWYLPFKPIGDAMISAFLVFGWFVWVYHRLPYWLRGQQGDVSGVITEVNKK